jgi:hypothetical protein
MTKQEKGRLGRPKTKNQGEINELAALAGEQAADAADEKIRSVRPQLAGDVGRRTVIRADDDDGPLTLRDDTDLENDNSAGLGLSAKERADDRKERQYVARIKGAKGKGARPRRGRGEVFGRVPPRPTTIICARCEWRPPQRREIVQSRRSANPAWIAMWTGDVGGLWVGLRRIKFYRLKYDIPNTQPRRFPFFVKTEAGDVPILKFRHLIHSRKSAGWAGAPDSIPPRTAAEFQFGRFRFSFDGHGNRIWWPHCYGSGALPEEAESDAPPEASFATDIFCEELCDHWWPVVVAEHYHAKDRTSLRKAFAKLAENPEAAEEYDLFPPLPKTESYPNGKWRIRPFFPRLPSIEVYPPPKPARAALLNRDRQRFYADAASLRQSKQKNSNKRWSSAVVDNGIEKRTKALNRRRIEKPRTLPTTSEEAYCREDGALMVQTAPHCYVNAHCVSASEFLGFAGQELDDAPRAWQMVTPRDRLPETIWPVDRQITESRHCSSVYENRKSALAAPCASAWRGWFLSRWACGAAITYVLGVPVMKPRVWLAPLVQEFLDRGGQIKICPPEKLSVERRKRGRPPLGEKAQTSPQKQQKYRDKEKLKKLQNAQDLLKPASALTAPSVSACPGVTASPPDCEAVTFGMDFQPE